MTSANVCFGVFYRCDCANSDVEGRGQNGRTTAALLWAAKGHYSMLRAGLIALSIIGSHDGAVQNSPVVGRPASERPVPITTPHIIVKVPNDFPNQFWLVSDADGSTASATARQSFIDLVKPAAPWPVASSRVKALVFRLGFLDALSHDQLHSLIVGAQARALSIGIDTSLLVATSRCGAGVPGYERAGLLKRVLDRVSALGGEIDIVSLHSPVWFAHRLTGTPYCHDTIDDVATQMLAGAHLFNTGIGGPAMFIDAEVADDATSGTELYDVLNFAGGFHRATGFVINEIHVAPTGPDLHRQHLREWQRRIAAADIDFGIVFGRSTPREGDQQGPSAPSEKSKRRLLLLHPAGWWL